jgi:hypothetical protein
MIICNFAELKVQRNQLQPNPATAQSPDKMQWNIFSVVSMGQMLNFSIFRMILKLKKDLSWKHRKLHQQSNALIYFKNMNKNAEKFFGRKKFSWHHFIQL